MREHVEELEALVGKAEDERDRALAKATRLEAENAALKAAAGKPVKVPLAGLSADDRAALATMRAVAPCESVEVRCYNLARAAARAYGVPGAILHAYLQAAEYRVVELDDEDCAALAACFEEEVSDG